MHSQQDTSLQELLRYLAAVHRRVAVLYRELAEGACTRSARLLLFRLAARESRLARSVLDVCNSADGRLRVPLPAVFPDLPTRAHAGSVKSSDDVVRLAQHIDTHIEQIIRLLVDAVAAGIPIASEAAAVHAAHRQELFTIGILADRLRSAGD